MPSRNNSLAAQAQENLRSAQAAHRQLHLQPPPSSAALECLRGSASSGSAACSDLTLRPLSASSQSSTARVAAASPSSSTSGQRPPQLPGIVTSGYPRQASSGVSSSNEVPDPPLHVATPADRSRSGGDGSASSTNRPRRGCPERASSSHSSRSGRARAVPPNPEDDDAEFADELLELEALGRSLGLHTSEGSPPELGGDPRPTTGLSHASCSTTVPPTSTRGALSTTSGSDGFDQHFDQDNDKAVPKDADCGEELLPGALVAQQELKQCRLPHGCRIQSMPGMAAQFFFVMDVSEGPFTPATLTFWIKVFDDYPTVGNISVRSSKRIFHPCVDPSTGRVAIAEDQLLNDRGVLSLQALFSAIRQIITSPEDSPSLNAEAAVLLQTDQSEFRRTVRSTLNGGEYRGTAFDRVLGANGLSTAGVVSKKSAKSADASESVPESVKLGLMQIENMKDKFMQMANGWSQQNAQEIRDLT